MTTQPEVIRHSDLLNQLVINRSTMEELGRVEVLWMYPPAHRVLGFICKTGFLGTKKFAFNLSQIHTFGTSSILVTSAPQETDGDKVGQLESLIDCEVWSDSGQKVGKITDCLFNLQTGAISQYLFVSGSGWSSLTEGVYQLPPSKILSLGRRRVLVAESVLQSLPTYREGIKQRLAKVKELLKDEVTHELRSLTQKAHEATEQAKERARSLAEQAKERAQALNEQLKEEAQTLAHQAQETSQSLVEQVKGQTQGLRDQFDQLADEFELEAEPEGEIPDSIFEEDWDIETLPSSPTTPSSELTSLEPSLEVPAVTTEVISSEQLPQTSTLPEKDSELSPEAPAPFKPALEHSATGKSVQPLEPTPSSSQNAASSDLDDLEDDEPWI